MVFSLFSLFLSKIWRLFIGFKVDKSHTNEFTGIHIKSIKYVNCIIKLNDKRLRRKKRKQNSKRKNNQRIY